MNQILTSTEEERERQRSVASILERAGRILSMDHRLEVKVTDSAEHRNQVFSAANRTITMFTRKTPRINDESLLSVYGYYYQALSRVFFSPRDDTNVIQGVIKAGALKYFNLLEAQRAETLMAAGFPTLGNWFGAAVGTWLQSSPDPETVYLFLAGRKYLPVELRERARKAFGYPDIVDDLELIVDEFRTLVFPADAHRGIQLAVALKNLLEPELTPEQQQMSGPNGKDESTMGQGKPMAGAQQQQELSERASADEEDDPVGKYEDEDEEEDDGPSPGQDRRDLSDMGKGMIEEISQNEDVEREVEQSLQTISAAGGHMVLEQYSYDERDVSAAARHAARVFGEQLKRLAEAAEPGYLSRQDSGRLDVVLWRTERNIEEAFKRWDDGVNDALDIEFVVLGDISGSQISRIVPVMETLWIIKKACSDVEIPCTTIVFDDACSVLYKAEEKAKPSKLRYAFNNGGTIPGAALAQAARTLGRSTAKVKILTVVTDGDWIGSGYGGRSNDQMILDMGRGGVHTSVVFMGANPTVPQEHYAKKAQHQAKQFLAVEDVRGVLHYVKRLITDTVAERARH